MHHLGSRENEDARYPLEHPRHSLPGEPSHSGNFGHRVWAVRARAFHRLHTLSRAAYSLRSSRPSKTWKRLTGRMVRTGGPWKRSRLVYGAIRSGSIIHCGK